MRLIKFRRTGRTAPPLPPAGSQCAATTGAGRRCKLPAHDAGYCRLHNAAERRRLWELLEPAMERLGDVSFPQLLANLPRAQRREARRILLRRIGESPDTGSGDKEDLLRQIKQVR
jgi:hypothetical protein